MAKKGSRFKKYDYQFKLIVVESYFSGNMQQVVLNPFTWTK